MSFSVNKSPYYTLELYTIRDLFAQNDISYVGYKINLLFTCVRGNCVK